MINHLSHEVLICFIDNESIPFERDHVRAHLRACRRCNNRYEELLTTSKQFEQLIAETIRFEVPQSDMFAIQLRRRLTQLAISQVSAGSFDQKIDRTPETSGTPLKESRPSNTESKPSFKVLKLPQRGHSFQTPLACSVTFTDGDNLFRKGHLAFAQGSLEQAIEYWREAKMVFLRLRFQKEIAACDRNVAVAQRQLGHNQQALDQFRKAKALFSRIGEIKAMNSCDLKIRELLKETTGRTWA